VAVGPPTTAVAALQGPPHPLALVSTVQPLPVQANREAPLAGTDCPPALKAESDVTRTSLFPPFAFSVSATVTGVASVHPSGTPTVVVPPPLNVP
jgi:hypothetical protein